jgi:hypothetical protein
MKAILYDLTGGAAVGVISTVGVVVGRNCANNIAANTPTNMNNTITIKSKATFEFRILCNIRQYSNLDL